MTIPPQIDIVLSHLDTFISKYPTLFQYEKLKQIEKKTGYPKTYFFLLGCVTAGLLLFVLGGAKLITDLVSFVYPAYMSFKAIDSGNTEDNTQWLTYWVVFSFVSILESCTTFLVELIPFYFFLKVTFFVWLYHPKFKGAGLVYSQFIKPYVVPYLGTAGSAQKKVQ